MKKYFSLLVLIFLLLGMKSGFDFRLLHRDAIVIDMHNDVVQRMMQGDNIAVRTTNGHSDLPRFREGGLDAEWFSIWVPPGEKAESYFEKADAQIDTVLGFIKKHSKDVALATTSAEVRRNVKQGKFVVLLGMEGGHPIGEDLNRLDYFYKRGVRYITLTWNNSTPWATSARDETSSKDTLSHKGLTAFGKKVIRRMNELGMLIDVSHAGEQTFRDVIHTSKKPVIASHSCAWELRHHWRNLKDDQLKAIAKTGGIVCINFAPFFLDSTFSEQEAKLLKRHKEKIDSLRKASATGTFLTNMQISDMLAKEYLTIRPPLSRLADHFEYVAKLIGVDHVGIGTDFDGINSVPLDMDDASMLPNLTRELLARGFPEEDVRKMLGENILRVMKETEKK